jgi:hypothetical protein
MSKPRTKQNKTRRKQQRDIPVWIRLPRTTVRLMEQWQEIFGYADRSEVVRTILALGLHAASEQWDSALS